jgi:tetrahydromethanopterin S-methyltransferase subunit B
MDDKERLTIIEMEVKSIKGDIIKSIKEDIHVLYKKTEEINSINTAIALLTSSINDLKLTVNTLNNKLDNTNTKINKVENVAETSNDAPTKEKAKLWDFVVQYIIMGIIGLVMGYVGMKLGAK